MPPAPPNILAAPAPPAPPNIPAAPAPPKSKPPAPPAPPPPKSPKSPCNAQSQATNRVLVGLQWEAPLCINGYAGWSAYVPYRSMLMMGGRQANSPAINNKPKRAVESKQLDMNAEVRTAVGHHHRQSNPIQSNPIQSDPIRRD
jgi:hypothetical protein